MVKVKNELKPLKLAAYDLLDYEEYRDEEGNRQCFSTITAYFENYEMPGKLVFPIAASLLEDETQGLKLLRELWSKEKYSIKSSIYDCDKCGRAVPYVDEIGNRMLCLDCSSNYFSRDIDD
jgi:hypothetical protein